MDMISLNVALIPAISHHLQVGRVLFPFNFVSSALCDIFKTENTLLLKQRQAVICTLILTFDRLFRCVSLLLDEVFGYQIPSPIDAVRAVNSNYRIWERIRNRRQIEGTVKFLGYSDSPADSPSFFSSFKNFFT